MTESPSKNGEQSGSKGPEATQFKPGNPGGPGRAAGSRNRATLALDALAEGEAQAVLEKQLELAKGGDQRAAEIILARVWPVRKGRPISLDLPQIRSASDVSAALGVVAESVAGGALTPEEGASVATLLEIRRRAIETLELDNRITALELERR